MENEIEKIESMRLRRISLDCDGVIADNGLYLNRCFRETFHRRLPIGLVRALMRGKEELETYTEKHNFDYQDVMNFFQGYEEKLFTALPDLRVVKGAREGIERLLEAGLHLEVNSYRPSEYRGKTQDTRKITTEWFKRNGIYVPVNTHESKVGKIKRAAQPSIISHTDDQLAIIEKITELRRKEALYGFTADPYGDFSPILFNNPSLPYLKPDDRFLLYNNWESLSGSLEIKWNYIRDNPLAEEIGGIGRCSR